MKKKLLKNRGMIEKEVDEAMFQIFYTLEKFNKDTKYHGSIHIKNLFVSRGVFKIGPPLIFNDKAEKKLA